MVTTWFSRPITDTCLDLWYAAHLTVRRTSVAGDGQLLALRSGGCGVWNARVHPREVVLCSTAGHQQQRRHTDYQKLHGAEGPAEQQQAQTRGGTQDPEACIMWCAQP